jgi:hypothetical protein
VRLGAGGGVADRGPAGRHAGRQYLDGILELKISGAVL